jgi:LuxR family maltose regulon positive regulatory protein
MVLRRSKTRPPREGAATLSRPGLLGRLSLASETHRWLLLHAPAGFGKSCSLSAWVRQRPAGDHVAWINIDPDERLATLIEALVAALDAADLPWPVSLRGLVEQAEASEGCAASTDTFARALESADAIRSGLIVLDDWHHCPDPRAQHWLAALVDRLPARWSLVLATRDELGAAWQLPLRRARGEVAEFGRIDLALDAAEVRAWARSEGWTDTGAVQALGQRSQGWPAALRLAFSAKRQGLPPAVAERDLFEFAASEVIDRLPADLRRFLLRCSVLPELSASRAAAVSGDADAAQRLADLRQRDLLVSEVDDRGTLRLHALFREALHHRLVQEAPALLPDLLRRAAAGEPDPRRRVQWLIAAGDAAAAAVELEACSAALITDGAAGAVQDALAGFSEAEQRHWPALAIVKARLAWWRWDFAAMLQALEHAPPRALAPAVGPEQQLVQAHRVVALDSTGQSTQRDALLAAMTGPDAALLAPLPSLLIQVTRLLPPQDPAGLAHVRAGLREVVRLADQIGTASAWYQALPPSSLFLLPGTLDVFEQMAGAMTALTADEPTPLRAWSAVMSGWTTLWRGDSHGAWAALERAEEDARWLGGLAPVLHEVRQLQALLWAVWQQAPQARQAVVDSVAALPLEAWPPHERAHAQASLSLERQARVATMLGDAAWLAELAGGKSLAQRLCAAALAAARGDAHEAAARWSALLPELSPCEGRGQADEIRLRLAAAQAQLGEPDAAAALLAPLLDAPQAAIELGPALLAGPAVLDPLAESDWSRRLSSHQQGLLERWRAVARREAARGPPATPPEAGLSPRERAVLACLAEGHSNKHIARALGLSPHTVKRHVANILDKLGLCSRGQAAAWFHAHAAER